LPIEASRSFSVRTDRDQSIFHHSYTGVCLWWHRTCLQTGSCRVYCKAKYAYTHV